ncbi:MAG: MATE family efflux transporter [Bacteroidales bacterium]|nr:MATE family efflux transporter [Lachnoclostridium sp.]MCM1383426.1 MATE family efflux transporter [Lachnoclostridium sp.]MCM1464275.1 MATE family efflux transporter [Bacteroidales bacterium]
MARSDKLRSIPLSFVKLSSETKEQRREQIITAPLLPLLIKTAIPTIIGMLVTVVYNLTDTFWIGKMDNKSMTAAVGIVFAFVSFVQAIGFWFGYGSGNVMSRRLGEGNEQEAEIVSSSGVVMALTTGIALMIPMLIWLEPLAALLGGNASESLMKYTVQYLRIMLLSVPFSLFATTVYNQLRLCGNVKDGMIGLLAGILANIILDPVLIILLRMGMLGAGLATLLGQMLGAVVLAFLSYRHGNIPVRFDRCNLGDGRWYHILAGGAPNFSRQGITSIASVLLNVAAADFGEATIAAFTVSSRVAALGYMIMIGFGQGFQPICAMNYGAKKYDRVGKAFRLTVGIGTVFMVIAAALYAVFAKPLIGMFLADDEVIRTGAVILRYQCISFPFLAFYAVSSMYMQNCGKYMTALVISIARQGIFYIPLLFALGAVFQDFGLYIVQPVSDILSFALAAVILGVRRDAVLSE